MTAQRIEPEQSDDMEWDIPCGYSAHTGDAPAIWAVVMDRSNCGHLRNDFLYYCGPCWEYRNHRGEVTCRTCGLAFPALSGIIRIERIGADR